MAEANVEARMAVNERLLREANERLQRLYALTEGISDENEFVCECGNPRCTDTIRMSLAEYETVRTAGRFFVAFGHARPDQVVAVGPRYLVVDPTG